MSERQDRECELLTKADVVRQYRYPLAQLNDDIKQGRIRCFCYPMSRFYIPREAIEARIRELAERRAELKRVWR